MSEQEAALQIMALSLMFGTPHQTTVSNVFGSTDRSLETRARDQRSRASTKRAFNQRAHANQRPHHQHHPVKRASRSNRF